VSRERFRERIETALGIRPENVRDNFGMAEHAAPYIECRHHRFHVPVYNRILIRDPVTMQVSPCGQPGLMELVTPFNAMMPTLAILSTDVAKIDLEPCRCGWTTPTFTLIGRGGLTKHKGCALLAQEIVRRGA
jgi:phenylacetate-coenzyme A ligase PaaK-like adenylate-forming protein